METPAILLLFTVSLIWGFTNPLMKRGATGIEKCSSVGSSWIQTFLHEIKFLLMNWKVRLSFVISENPLLRFAWGTYRFEHFTALQIYLRL
jgi:hypothetical protein